MTKDELKAKYCFSDAMSVMERIKAAKTPKELHEVVMWCQRTNHKFTAREKAAYELQRKITGDKSDKYLYIRGLNTPTGTVYGFMTPTGKLLNIGGFDFESVAACRRYAKATGIEVLGVKK